MNKVDVSKILTLMSVLPNAPKLESKEQADSLVDVFHAVLHDIEEDLGKAAAIHYLSTKTFFPAPGDLRNKAMEIRALGLNIPSPAEAWGQVLGAIRHVPTTVCEDGQKIRQRSEGKTGREYWQAVDDDTAHRRTCTLCADGGLREIYDHPIVQQTVKMLGGRDVIMTDNPTADRARFIEAYREIVAREGVKAGMLPIVRESVDKQRLTGPEKEIMRLADGMRHV